MFTRIHLTAAVILAASMTGFAQSGVDFRDAIRATTPSIVAITIGLNAEDATPVTIESSKLHANPALRWYSYAQPTIARSLVASRVDARPMRSGFAVAPDLVISWNMPSDHSQVVMVDHDGGQLAGRVVVRDHVTSLVAIRIEEGSLKGIELTEQAPEAGLPVLVSWLRDAKTVTSDASMIATTANPNESQIGFSQRLDGEFSQQTSGAPVIDADGRVVGVLVPTDSGVSVCLPPISVTRLIKAASAQEPGDLHRGRIGIHLDGEANAVVAQIADDSPAKDAGVEVGDKVMKVGDYACTSPADVMAAVAMYRAGEEVRFRLQRGDETITRVVELTSVEEEVKPRRAPKIAAGQQLFQLKDGQLVPMDDKVRDSAIGKALEWLNKNNQGLKAADVVVPLDVDAINGRITLRVERSRLEDSLKKLEAQKAEQDKMIKQLREKISLMETEAKAKIQNAKDVEVARLQELVEEIKKRIKSEQ